MILPITNDKDIMLNAMLGCLENEMAARLEREEALEAQIKIHTQQIKESLYGSR